MINHPELSSSSSRRPADLYKIWMERRAERDQRSRIEPDLQISAYQAGRYSNDAGHGVGLIPFRGNGLKFSSGVEYCSLFSMRAGNLLIHEVGWN